MNPALQDIATAALAQKFYAHRAHHLAKGPTGPTDHQLFGEFYATYDRLYDTLVEFALALGQTIDHVAIHENAAASLRHHAEDRSTDKFFHTLLWMEDRMRNQIMLLMTQHPTDDVQALLQEIAHDSRQRTFTLSLRSPTPAPSAP